MTPCGAGWAAGILLLTPFTPDDVSDKSPARRQATTDREQGRSVPDGGRPVVDDAIASFDWAVTVAAGVGAAVLGYVIFSAVFVLGPASFGRITDPMVQIKLLGRLFYNSHFVDTLRDAPPGKTLAVSPRGNFILQNAGSSELPIIVYLLIPVVVLLLVGVAMVLRRGDREWAQAAYTGAGLAVGYELVLLLGTVVVSTSSQQGTITPDRLQVAAFGLAYPVILGTLGAALGVAYVRYRTGDS